MPASIRPDLAHLEPAESRGPLLTDLYVVHRGTRRSAFAEPEHPRDGVGVALEDRLHGSV